MTRVIYSGINNDNIDETAPLKEDLIEEQEIKKDSLTNEIRVLIESTNQLHHAKVQIRAEDIFIMNDEINKIKLEKNQMYEFDRNSFENTDIITLNTINPQMGFWIESLDEIRNNSPYYGTIILKNTDNGILLINQLDIEEYLCSVVPSEMPSYFEEEALKTQAICARSFALSEIQSNKLKEYGADVYDSEKSQVYHRIKKQDTTNSAVEATKGIVITYREQVVPVFYFSTSNGHTTDITSWGKSQSEYPYLTAKPLVSDNGIEYEKNEKWYKWKTTIKKEEFSKVLDTIEKYKDVDSEHVIYKIPDQSITDIDNIKITELSTGNSVNEIIIESNNNSVVIKSEFVIRQILGNKDRTYICNNDEMATNLSLLPSPFFTIKCNYKQDHIESITLIGGGLGHGIGMSQNGANCMAKAGMDYEEIIAFFFENVECTHMNGLL